MKADMILKSQAVFRGIIAEPTESIVAIKGSRIVYVGDVEKMQEYLGEDTKVYDFGNKLIMPGFHDAHIHMYMSSMYASPYIKVIKKNKSEEQCVADLKELAEKDLDLEKDRWLIGTGWYHPLWEDPRLPTKASLDAAFGDRPVCMVSRDCHTMWFNSAGLLKAGLSKGSTPPEGGTYDYLENGELSGVVHEAATFALNAVVYTFPQNEELDCYRKFIRQLNAYGITSVCDVSMMPGEGLDFVRNDIYEKLLESGELTVRVNMYPTLGMNLDRPLKMREKYTGQVLKCTGVKQFQDGVSSCHTAYLKEDYTNAHFPGDRGKPTIPVESMRKMILHAAENDFSVRIHAIGDQAIHELLDIFEEAEKIYGRKPYLQHTLEHLENFQTEDIGRLAKAHVLPSVQPPHVMIDTIGVERDLGSERVKDMWPFRRLLDAGSTLAFGTDSPCVGVNPFYGIYNAVTRQSVHDQEPKGGWLPTEKITLAEALSSYTYGSACAASMEHDTGTLAPGKLADIAVLDRNLFDIDPEQIPDTKVVMTIMDGKIVYQGE